MGWRPLAMPREPSPEELGVNGMGLRQVHNPPPEWGFYIAPWLGPGDVPADFADSVANKLEAL